LKDYKRHIIWLDYFNSSLSREGGRRVRIDRCVKDPKLEELVAAARRLGYAPESEVARYPKRFQVSSGYVSLEKRAQAKKTSVISELAKTLSVVRGEIIAKAAAQEKRKQKQILPKRH
jgi:signal recognition particle subunit SEC65